MGQQASRKSECVCGCGYPERSPPSSSVQRYMSAVTDRLGGRDCNCRRRRRSPCVCTSYRRVHDDRLAVLSLGHDLGGDVDTFVLNAEGDLVSENEPVPELYVLSVPQRGDCEPRDDPSSRFQQQLQVVCGAELRALLLRSPGYRPEHSERWTATRGCQTVVWANPENSVRVHTQVDYIHCLVPDLEAITACSFYWGKMDRYEAERLLDNKPEGTFLLRDSAQEDHLFSVSFRKYGRSLHARIEHCHRKFSFDSHDPAVYCADTVTGLVDHYKDPACVMFFEPMLTAPLPRTEPFSLQQLARAVIVSRISYDGVESLPLPSRMRAYLKEYHYRQRVRVRRLEPDLAIFNC